MITATIDVTAGQPYQVVIGHCSCRLLADYLQGVDKVAIVHPPVLAERARTLAAGLEGTEVLFIEVPDAERAKTGQALQACWEALAGAGFTRSDAVVGFGGGATTDLAGFVAATWLRGVRYISVPTSVLGMVDAAVGGKTGINLTAGKNLVGAFYEPFTVICDLDHLASLPQAEVRGGLAEIVKAGFIADPEILTMVERDPQVALDTASDTLAELIRRAIEVKAAVVGADLRERTSVGSDLGRERLNYGHTLGHAIERHQEYRWRHGEAISVGMVFAAEVSRRAGRLDEATASRHREILGSLGLPVSYPADAWPQLRAAMNLDKKTRGSSLRLVILDALARPAILAAPDETLLAESFAALGKE